MHILVITTNKETVAFMETTYGGHEHKIVVVESYDDAMELFERHIDMTDARSRLAKESYTSQPSIERERRRFLAFCHAWNKAKDESVISYTFDVVVTDMMLPMSKFQLDGRPCRDPFFISDGSLVPYGFTLAIKAAIHGARLIVIAMDENTVPNWLNRDQAHPGIDSLAEAYLNMGRSPDVTINGACVIRQSPAAIDLTAAMEASGLSPERMVTRNRKSE